MIMFLDYLQFGFAIFTVFSSRVGSESNIEEYCERESFEAKCANDEIIVMRSAAYGRMRIGRCVRNEYGAVGCSVNVLPRVQALCSGRRQCEFPVSDLHDTVPCPNDLINFLEASYDCVKVSRCETRMCDGRGYLRIASSIGNIASIVTSETGCGSSFCPWVIEPKPGQRLNLTFHNFNWPADGAAELGCRRYATVVDKGTKVSKDITICGHDNRQLNLITSPSSAIEIRFYVGEEKQSPPQFLLKYQAIGCPDITPPAGATLSRDGDHLSVRCTDSLRSWHLACSDTDWVGEIGTCSEGQVWNLGAALEDAGTTPEGLMIVIGVGLALGVILGFSMLAFAFFYMKRKQSRNQYSRGEALMRQSSAGSGTLYDQQVPVSDLYYRSSQPCGLFTRPSTRTGCEISDYDPASPVPTIPRGMPSRDDVGRGRRDHVYESPTAFVGQGMETEKGTLEKTRLSRPRLIV